MSVGQQIQYFGRDLEAMAFARNYHRWIADELAPFLGSRVAEVGAGSGNFSQLLLATPGVAELHAFEPSANMYPLLQAQLARFANARSTNGFFGDHAAEHRQAFDSICYVNVLEHVALDGDELRQASIALRPGGHLLVFVPALPWLFSKLDQDLGHHRRYRKAELVSVVESAGLEVSRVKYFDLPGVLPWFVAFVLLGRTLTGGSVSLYDRLLVPLTRRLEGAIEPPLGKNLLLVARKPDARG